jgi:leucyl-tRNA synthetase
LRRRVHQALRKVTADLEGFQFNTVISTLMELLNELVRVRDQGLGGTEAFDEALGIYVRMLAPVAPHLAEELWHGRGGTRSVHLEPWPEVDEAATAEDSLTLPVQVNGKVRDRITVPVDTTQAEIERLALETAGVKRSLEGRPPRKVIVVPGRLVNVVG